MAARRQQQLRRGQARWQRLRQRARPLVTATRAAMMPEPGLKEDTATRSVADYLRSEKYSGLKTKEAVQYEKRVEYFKGSKLIDALVGPKYKGKVATETPIKSRADAAKVGQTLLTQGYFHRSSRVTHAHTRRWELEMTSGSFEEDGMYTWVYEGSKTKLYVLTGGMLLAALGMCMIQIWPLWMKIGVWWCSITFLTTLFVLSVVRVALFLAMWIVGFRGIWLFPNLFDDNQTIAGSFMPIFGKGDPIIIYEDSDEEYNEFQRKKSKKKGDSEKEGEQIETKGGKKVVRKKASEEADAPKWQFGLINIMVIFGVGGLWCLNMGLFDGDNVPDFVAKRDDLQYYFKALSAPEVPNATQAEGDGRDPFAAPEGEEEQRF